VIQSLTITNYRSIAQATVQLQPFTVLVGANGSGKSNLLKLLNELPTAHVGHDLTKHFAHPHAETRIEVVTPDGIFKFLDDSFEGKAPRDVARVRIFSIDPLHVGGIEELEGRPEVQPDGQGVIRVLDSLKTGDREDLFDAIESQLHAFVPEVEKLSFAPGEGGKSLQVRERGIPRSVPVRDLSEGTRLVLTILTIVHQERKPSIICLEDIDRGLHPALFGKLVEVCRALVRGEGAPQIIATTQNPYFVDQFVDDEDSVVLVEKENANTTFTTLTERLASLGARTDSLGAVWYSGLVGGVPKTDIKHLPRK
jgi:predicted ATPase